LSKVAITGNASGTGVFTVASPNSNTDRVLTLPDETGTVDTLQRSGNVVQVVNFQTGAVATGTTVIPFDDTIPQITEGNEFMTLAITPTNASNILVIQVFAAQLSVNAISAMIAALFQDSAVNALASAVTIIPTNGYVTSLAFSYRMTAGTTSATTFKLRAAGDAEGTTTFNGPNAGRRLGGVSMSSITITEYTP